MEEKQRYTFSKQERLSNEKLINQLFSCGKSFIEYPIRIVYFPIICSGNEEKSIKTLITVPKKNIKSAVKRNRIKRQIREVYRLNKHILSCLPKQKNRTLMIGFIYLNSEIIEFSVIEQKMIKALNKLMNINE